MVCGLFTDHVPVATGHENVSSMLLDGDSTTRWRFGFVSEFELTTAFYYYRYSIDWDSS